LKYTVKSARAVLTVVLLLGVVWFALRGPVRGIGGGNFDFALIYSAARAWLLGKDPYSMEVAQRVFVAAGGPKILEPMSRPESSLVYSPATFVVLAPVAALPWVAANWVWSLANIALVGVSLLLLARLARLGTTATMALWASMLWLAPAATSLYVGQVSIVVLALLSAGELLRRRALEGGSPRHLWVVGLLLGFAAVIKPQLGLLFLVYEAGRLRWRSVVAGVLGVALLTLIGAARLEVAGISWLDTWLEHVRQFGGVGDGDPSRANIFRYQMINLAYPVYSVMDSRALASGIIYAMLGLLSAAYFVVDLERGRERGEGRGELLSLSMTAGITLLVTYHRAYDAVILIFPLAMGWRGFLAGRHDEDPHEKFVWPRRWDYGVLLLLMLPFAAPGAGILAAAQKRGWVPEGLSATWLWRFIIMPHATWALVAMCAWLIVLRARTGPRADQSMP
jgi:hypothetical protein